MPAQRKIDLPMQTRLATIQPTTVNAEKRTVDVIWSTGAKVRRYDWWNDRYYDEELSLEPGEADLSRLNVGAAFLNNHQQWDLGAVLGAVVPGSARLEDGQGVATIQLSQRNDVEPIWGDIQSGIIRNISIGYQVRKYVIDQTQGEIPVYRAVDWTPFEISAVCVPADPGAQMRGNRESQRYPCEFEIRATAAQTPEQEENPMPDDNSQAADTRTAENANNQPAAPAPVNTDAIRSEAAAAERARIAEIRSACGVAKMDDAFTQRHIDAGTAMDKVRKEILDEMAKRSSDSEIRGQNTVVTQDPTVHQREAVENALLHRFDPGRHALSEHGRHFRGIQMIQIGAELLELRGIKTRGLPKAKVAEMVLGLAAEVRAGGAMSTSDFPSILANIANKTLRQAYESTRQTFKPISRQGSATDFKQITRTQMSGAPSLVLVGENGEFERGSLSDAKEVYALGTYGKILPFTRQALINDDMAAFTRIPQQFGAAAADLESDTVWAVITANANMSDGNALFSAAHSNYTASGTAISITSLGVARAAMRQQKGLEGRLINVQPVTLAVPSAQETLAQQITTASNVIYTKYADQNPFANTLQVIAEPRLDVNSTTAWYLFGSPEQVDIVEYAYLEGSEGPQMATRIGFDVDGVEIKCSEDFAAKALDWRAAYKNAGA